MNDDEDDVVNHMIMVRMMMVMMAVSYEFDVAGKEADRCQTVTVPMVPEAIGHGRDQRGGCC